MSHHGFYPIDSKYIRHLQKECNPVFNWGPKTSPYYIAHKVNIPRPLVPNYGLPGKGTYKIVYDYPLQETYIRRHTLVEPGRLVFYDPYLRTQPNTRRRGRLREQAYDNPPLKELLQKIEDDYHTVYQIENDERDPQEDIPTDWRIVNRGKTFGPFGIMGHVLDDLVLENVSIYADPDISEEYYVVLDIGS